MTTAFLSVGLKTESALTSVRALKAELQKAVTGLTASVNEAALITSVQSALKKAQGQLDVRINEASLRAQVGTALNQAFAAQQTVHINQAALTAQVRAAVQAGLGGGAVPVSTPIAASAVVPDSSNLDRLLTQALVPTLDRLAKSIEDGMRAGVARSEAGGGAGGRRRMASRTLGAIDPETGERVSIRSSVAPDDAKRDIDRLRSTADEVRAKTESDRIAQQSANETWRVRRRLRADETQVVRDAERLEQQSANETWRVRRRLRAEDVRDRQDASRIAQQSANETWRVRQRLRAEETQAVRDAEGIAQQSANETWRVKQRLRAEELRQERERLRELQARARISAGGDFTPFGARVAGVGAVVSDVGEDRARRALAPADRALIGEVANLQLYRKALKDVGEEAEKVRPPKERLTGSMRSLNAMMREGHSAARGLTGSLGLLWTTYGSFVPLVAFAALGAGMRSVITVGKDVEYQLKFVQVLSNGAAVDIKSFGDAVRGSLALPVDAAAGLRALAQNGLSAREALAALPAILNLATAGEMEIADAALGATGVMAAFNLQVSDLGRIGDVFAKAAASSNTSVSAMVESMKQASTVADQYKVSLEETAAGLAILAQRNITGTAAGTAYRNMWVELATPTKRAKEIMDTLRLSLYDGNYRLLESGKVLDQLRSKLSTLNEQSRLTTLNELFGERGAKAANAIISNFDDYLEMLRKVKEESKDFTQSVVQALQQPTEGKLKALFAEFQLSATAAFDSTSTSVKALVDQLRGVVASEGFARTLQTLVSGAASLTTAMLENGRVVLATIAIWKVTGWAFAVVEAFHAIRAAAVAAGVAVTGFGLAARTMISAATGGLGLIVALGVEYFLLRDRTDAATESQKAFNLAMDAEEQRVGRSIDSLREKNRLLEATVNYQRQGMSAKQASDQAERDMGRAGEASLDQQIIDLRKREQRLLDRLNTKPEVAAPGRRTLEESRAIGSQRRQAESDRQELGNVQEQIRRFSEAKVRAQVEANEKEKGVEFAFQGERLTRIADFRKRVEAALKEDPKLKPKIGGLLSNLDLLPADRDPFEKAIKEREDQLNNRLRTLTIPDANQARRGDLAFSNALIKSFEDSKRSLEQALRFRRELDEARNPQREFGPYMAAVMAEQRAIKGTTELVQQQVEALEVLRRIKDLPSLEKADRDQLNTRFQSISAELELSRKQLEHEKERARLRADSLVRGEAADTESMKRKLREDVGAEIEKFDFRSQKKATDPRDVARIEAELRIEQRYREDIRKQALEMEERQRNLARLQHEGAEASAVELSTAHDRVTEAENLLGVLQAMQAIDKAKAGARAVEMFERSQTAEFGFERFWAEYRSTGLSSAQIVHDGLKLSADGMANAIGSFVTTGKGHFRSFVASVTAEVARMMATRAMVQFIGFLLNSFGGSRGYVTPTGLPSDGFVPNPQAGFAHGGIMTSYGPLPLRRYGAGGVANSPQVAIFGEGKKPEAYVPLEDGRSIPVRVLEGGGGSISVGSIQVNIDGDGNSRVETDASGRDGAALARAVESAVIQELVKQKRPGGLLYARA